MRHFLHKPEIASILTFNNNLILGFLVQEYEMTDSTHNKNSRLFELERDHIDAEENFSYAERKVGVSENITTLCELQTLSDLSAEFQNASATSQSKKDIREILEKSQTLHINNLTDNLDESDKSEAARLIANIITQNPYLERLFLEYNNFSDADLAKIIRAVVEAKSNPLLNTHLEELHLRNLIPAESLSGIAKNLHTLKQKYSMVIDVDHHEAILIKEMSAKTKSAKLFDKDAEKTATIPATPKKLSRS
jgi:hypothetical protein